MDPVDYSRGFLKMLPHAQEVMLIAVHHGTLSDTRDLAWEVRGFDIIGTTRLWCDLPY
jgi:hypothetical protein